MNKSQSRASAIASATQFESLEDRRLMSAGSLDPTFGVGGKLSSADIGFTPVKFAVQNDGKIIAVGNPLDSSFEVARLNANGSLDTTFGEAHNGTETIRVGAVGEHDEVSAVAVTTSGKIVVAGSTLKLNSIAHRYDYDQMAIVRLTASGAPDDSFGQHGRVTAGFDDNSTRGSAMAIQKDGKIVVAGSMYDGGFFNADYDDFAIIRFNTNGTLDSSFGNGGRRHQDFNGNEYASAIAIDYNGTAQSNPRYGTIVVGGTGYDDDGRYLAFTRLRANGAADTNFGGNEDARIMIKARDGSTVNDMVIIPGGRVVAVGTDGLNSVELARLMPNGAADSTFGNKGIVTTNLDGKDEAEAVRFSGDDNRFLVGGYAHGDFALTRYNYDGSRDQSFGTSGTVKTDFGGAEQIRSLTTTDDGRIVAVGLQNGSHRVRVTRYVPSSPTVRISSQHTAITEHNGDNTFTVTRDAVLGYPTRVYFSIGGAATLNTDYTGLNTVNIPIFNAGAGSISKVAAVRPAFLQGGVSVQSGVTVGYADIPAGDVRTTFTIHATDDSLFESNEDVVLSLNTNEMYSTSPLYQQAKVTIADDDVLHVNFEAQSNIAAGKYLSDTGAKFGDRGNGFSYGWDANLSNQAAIRASSSSPDFRYDSFVPMQNSGASHKWEVGLPNGTYQVRIVAGDPDATDSHYRMNLEGQAALSGDPSGEFRWFRSTSIVTVSDGRLTLTNGTVAANNKIDWIDIKAAPAGKTPGPVNGAFNLPVARFSASTASQWTKGTDGLFSDQQIDETLWESTLLHTI